MIVKPNMGLVVWDSINDYFSHVQLKSNFEALDEHDHTAGKGKKIAYGGLAEQSVGPENLREGVFTAANIANGTITNAKLAAEAKPFKWYPPCIIATEQEIAPTTYETLATPDIVESVVMPTNGLIEVNYYAQATAGSTGTGVAAGIFLGANQVKAGPLAAEATINNAAFKDLVTGTTSGLVYGTETSALVTTGQMVGGVSGSGSVKIFAAAGTYSVSIKYKHTSGIGMKVKNRKLWVTTHGV